MTFAVDAPGAISAMGDTDDRPATPRRTASTGRTSACALLLLTLLIALSYANALKAGYTFDDEPDIQNNPAVRNGIDPIGILASPLHPGDLYRPVSTLTFALNESFAPGSAFAAHSMNLCLHLAVTMLVFFLATALFDSIRLALIAAMLFAVQPVHTEAVTSLVGRAELLAALFGVAAMLNMVAADRAHGQSAAIALRLSAAGWFSLAVLSKESAVVFVLLIPLFRIACRREPLLAGLVREYRSMDWVPYVLCAGAFLLLRFLVLRAMMVNTVTPLDNALAFVPWSLRVRSAIGVLWDYFGLLNFPAVLSADYSYSQVPVIARWTDPRFLAGSALLVAAACVLLRDPRPSLTFAVALPFVALSLTSNVLFPIGTIKAERLLYFPSVGWALLVAYGFDRLLAVRRYRLIGATLFVTVIAAFAARTWARNADWADNATLYRSTVRSAPNSAKAHYNLAVILRQEHNDAAALVEFRRALAIYHWEGGANAAHGVGVIFDTQGRTDEAIEWYRTALDIEPDFVNAHTNLCRALLLEARYSEAVVACRRGLRFAPGDANLLKAVGESLIGNGERDKGIAVLHRSLSRNPQDHELRARIAQLENSPADLGESSPSDDRRANPAA